MPESERNLNELALALDRRAREIESRSAEMERRARELEHQAEEFRRGVKELLQAEKLASLGGLVAGITHELNNPLAVITGFAELLLSNPSLEADAREALEAIHGEARRCTRIVTNLLSFARQRRPTRAPIDVAEVIDRAAELLRYKLALDDVELDLHLDRTARPALGDLSQVQQVILQLLMNAHQGVLEVDPSQRARRIRVATREAAARVEITVEDSGPGIAPGDLPRVFDPFFEMGSRGREGAGLGLSLCYGIVTEHGGKIEVASEVGRGTTFRIELPLAGAAGAPAPTPPDVAARRQAAHGKGVLVADDEPQIVKLLTQVLSREGYVVGTASDGEEALRLAKSGAYDVLVVDLWMPRLDGIALFRRLEKEMPDLAQRVIFTTGDSYSDEAQDFLTQEGRRFLKKPMANEEVARLVAEVARTAPPRKSAARE
jgi:two-component system NtrC family sensor kinase